MSAKQKIPVVYVAGPYRAATRELIAENIAEARAVAVSTARLGWFPLCPHTNTAHFDDGLPGQDQFFLDGTLALMERCDAVVLVNGWRYSAGTLGEVHRARELGMPIFACLEDLPTAEEFAEQSSSQPFQSRVKPWLLECFGELIAADRQERNHRFLEEALELVQATGCTVAEAHQLVEYVYGRPAGEASQEVGGVMVTLAALCLAHGIDMHTAGETELARIWTKVEQIRAKQAAKPAMSPLPGAYPDREQPAPNYNRKPIAIDDQVRARLALVAREAAISSAHRYSYMPTTPEDALLWEPHAWVIDAMRMVEQPAPVAVVTERLAQVLKFLEGAENLDGYWFGEPGPHGSKVWWRAELRKALAETKLFAKQQ